MQNHFQGKKKEQRVFKAWMEQFKIQLQLQQKIDIVEQLKPERRYLIGWVRILFWAKWSLKVPTCPEDFVIFTPSI